MREQIVPEFLGMLGTGAGMSGNTAESGFTPRRLVIVGCRGRMGTLLSARWSAAGHTVAGLDLPLTDEVFAAATARLVRDNRRWSENWMLGLAFTSCRIWTAGRSLRTLPP